MPLVYFEKLINITMELGESRVKVWGFFAKQKNDDSRVIIKSISSHLVERLAEVFVGPRCFSELEHTILDTNVVLIM